VFTERLSMLFGQAVSQPAGDDLCERFDAVPQSSRPDIPIES
jgi:hypothetical protein